MITGTVVTSAIDLICQLGVSEHRAMHNAAPGARPTARMGGFQRTTKGHRKNSGFG